MNIIEEKHLNNLFINYFDKITINNNLIENYKWKNISNIFNTLYEKLILLSDSSEFIKNYYLIMLYFINYTNFLKYIKHPDYELSALYIFLDKIKYNCDILKYIKKNIDNNDIKNILTTFNPFLQNKIKILKIFDKKQLNNFIDNIKNLENIYLSNNTTNKKIINVLIYRYILSNNVQEINYHNFIINNIIENNTDDILNLDYFIKNIPNYKNILNLTVNFEIKNNLNIKLIDLIKFLINENPNIKIEFMEISNKKIIQLTNIKFGGKIIIKKSLNKINKINLHQQNINLINFNIKELKKNDFIKKTNNFIVIEYISSTIKDLSTLLHLTHLITCGIKLLNTYSGSIYECMYPIDYNKYYYKTFINFLTFIKDNINKYMDYNRFLIDLIKYYYIYSYYDYYFYYNSNLAKTLVDNIKFKYDIFNEFCDSLKFLFNLPNTITNYPPFFDIDDDLDNLIYYTLEIPNYFKFYDLINALIFVYDIKISNNTNYDLIKIILTINCNLTNNVSNDKVINNSDLKNDENISKISIENIPKNEKKLAKNNNAFIELNIENSENYALNTEFIT